MPPNESQFRSHGYPFLCRVPYINYISSAEMHCRAMYDKQDIVRTRTVFAFQSRERLNDHPYLLLCCISSHLQWSDIPRKRPYSLFVWEWLIIVRVDDLFPVPLFPLKWHVTTLYEWRSSTLELRGYFSVLYFLAPISLSFLRHDIGSCYIMVIVRCFLCESW